MNTQDFFPTPKKLIKKLLNGIELGGLDILEPSAGKGDICDFIKENSYRRDSQIDVIEIDKTLQATLRGKGYNLIHDDFLTFQTSKKYHLIVANFPFSEGAEHLNHAMRLLALHGGKLVCLVNAETIKNPYTNLRKTIVKKLTEFGAEIEYLENEFTDAERKTNVEVALIKVDIPSNFVPSLILDSMKRSEVVDIETDAPKELVENDFIDSMIARFNLEVKVGMNLIAEYEKLVPLMLESIPKSGEDNKYNRSILELSVKNNNHSNTCNSYLEETRHKYWEVLLNNKSFAEKYTSNILKELYSKLNELRKFDFTRFNVESLKEELDSKIVGGIEKSIIDLFDVLSRQFAYGETFGDNIHYYNGWKTNKAHKINKKVIIPMNGFSSYSKDRLDYYVKEKLDDMVKVFSYFDRLPQDSPSLVGAAIEIANRAGDFRNMDLKYFDTTFFKKGTCHITFKDQKLLDKFNVFGSQKKGWLPPSYGKKRYKDMDAEEKSIIDSFQGEEEYEEVLLNYQEYVPKSNVLLLN